MVKAIFFDIDGTLVSFNTHRVPDSTREAIEKIRSKGIKVFIATGRHLSVINNLDDMEFDGYITMNGCYCLQGKDNVIFKKSIPSADIDRLIDYMQQEKEFACLFVEEHQLSINYIDDDMRFLMDLLKQDVSLIYKSREDAMCKALEQSSVGGAITPGFPAIGTFLVDNLDYYRDKELFQLTAFFKQSEEEAIMRMLSGCTSMRWYPTFADVIAKGVDKGVGIDQFCKYYGFSVEETMAFGDGGNDIEMLRHSGIGVAMGNARQEVKQSADYVTDTVDNDGIWKALQHFKLV